MNSNKKIVLGVTGIRSEYDILSSVFRAISKHDDLLLKVAVTGAHLSESFGHTIDEIKNDGFEIVDRIESLLSGNRESLRVKGLGIQLQGLVQTVLRVNPDFLLVLGDREESIAVALVSTYMNIPMIHIGGGDRVVGNADDQIRHAVTKLAHIHLTTNSESEERVLRLGEQKFRVHNVGNPGLDRLLAVESLSLAQISRNINFDVAEDEPYIILIQHPLSSEIKDAYRQMKITLSAIRAMGIKTIISFPNSDAGGGEIIRAIEEHNSVPFIYSAKNIPRVDFVNLLRNAACLVGNSSCGILEAPLLKLPVINIGNRQIGRLHAENVQFVLHEKSAIIGAIKTAVYDENYISVVNRCGNPYGDGKSSYKIAEIIASTIIDEKLLVKDITY
ncbi:UDP-N-acetylglucosamine 2-epimerase [Amylibacter sp.]|nr:UDP-N-acetylglucosamine 2-epimerase [Amylibacter sp.]